MKTKKSHNVGKKKKEYSKPSRESRKALMNLIVDRFLDDNTKLSSCQLRMMVLDFIQFV